mmetsp:Transcript_16211/g.50744  ORF Transcript_16211/g.50744 Transcript_16211/m.50744 type:complete len:201 (+) Transcript_16211:541-1143(+)
MRDRGEEEVSEEVDDGADEAARLAADLSTLRWVSQDRPRRASASCPADAICVPARLLCHSDPGPTSVGRFSGSATLQARPTRATRLATTDGGATSPLACASVTRPITLSSARPMPFLPMRSAAADASTRASSTPSDELLRPASRSIAAKVCVKVGGGASPSAISARRYRRPSGCRPAFGGFVSVTSTIVMLSDHMSAAVL